jgi:hypothetical protein
MPSEAEHKLEQVLRTWAKQRREEHKRDFELHPATRRLLMAEVVRRYPKRVEPRVPWRVAFGRLWTRTVSVVGLLIVLAVGGWALKYSLSNLRQYGDADFDNTEPPRQIAFSLRKRSAEKEQGLAPAMDKPSAPAAPVVAMTNGPSVAQLWAERTGGRAVTSVPVSPAPEALAMGDKAVLKEAVRDDTSRPLALAPKVTGSASAAAAVAKAEESKPTLSATKVPDSVAMFKESLDRGAVGSAAEAKGAAQSSDLTLARKAAPAAVIPSSVAPRAAGLPAASAREQVVSANTPAAAPATIGGMGLRGGSRQADTNLIAIATTTAPAAPGNSELAMAPKLVERTRAPATEAVFGRPAGAVAGAAGNLFFCQVPSVTELGRSTPAALTVERALTRDDLTKGMGVAGAAVNENTAPVLRQFELKRDGTLVTVVDADGSVYAGAITRLDKDKAALLSDGFARDEAKPAGEVMNRTSVGTEFTGALAIKELQTPMYFFRVSGTNRTSSQRVVLSATVSSLAGAPDDALGKPQLLQTRQAARAYAEPSPTAAAAAPSRSAPATSSRFKAKESAGSQMSSGAIATTNALLLQGRLRIGTNAEQPLKALRLQ